MKQRSEREESVSWTALYGGMNQGWWRHGRARMLMQTVPGFGRGGTRGDFWADAISKEFSRMVVAKTTPAGRRMTPGLFSWASTLSMGRDTGATPDGRGNGDPISFGANPNPGRLRGGTLINANVLDREQILDAYRNPSKYPDLVVRATGFSACFASLSDAFRRLVDDRIVAMEDAM
jgi:formate C-acetyltransferase